VAYSGYLLPAGYPIAGHRADAAGGEELLAAGMKYVDLADYAEEADDGEDGGWLDDSSLVCGDDPAVAATALVAIGLVATPGRAQALTVLEAGLDDPRDVVSWGAATGLARLKGQCAGTRVRDELRWCPGRDDKVPFRGGDLRGYAELSLTLLGNP
jgi:hypothetical protein